MVTGWGSSRKFGGLKTDCAHNQLKTKVRAAQKVAFMHILAQQNLFNSLSAG
jgi:hypothetical protein